MNLYRNRNTGQLVEVHFQNLAIANGAEVFDRTNPDDTVSTVVNPAWEKGFFVLYSVLGTDQFNYALPVDAFHLRFEKVEHEEQVLIEDAVGA